MKLKFPCKQHKKYKPDTCVDCENGLTEVIDDMIVDLKLFLKVKKKT